jgi:hypothetical protein
MINKNGIFCTTTIVRKGRGENDVTSCEFTSGCDVTSGYGVTSGQVTDVTSGSTEQQQRLRDTDNNSSDYIT